MRPADRSRLVPICVAALLGAACGGSSGGGDDAGAPVTCGNGVLDPGEECDDGNRVSFDGCSDTCHVEESQRVNWMEMQFGTDSACADNALGGAVVASAAQSQLQSSITSGVGDGSISVMMEFVGAPDPTGGNQSGLTIGILGGGSPEQPAGSPSYDGSSDLDWWYTPDPAAVDASGAPLAQLSASISGSQFTAGPGSLTISVSLGGSTASMSLSNAVLKASVGALSAPVESAAGLPPGHLAAEHVSPALQSFGSLGAPNSAGAGTLCGHVSAKSLSTTLLPSAVVNACSGFSTSNSLLDLMVAGCKAYGILQAVDKTQPDQVDASKPAAGAGGPYKLSASSGVTVNTCKDKGGATVDLGACLTAAAYSSYFKFATDRVIIRK